MSAVQFYGYSKCSTCRKALKWLSDQGIEVEKTEIRENPPSEKLIAVAVEQSSGVRKVFNTSGQDYRKLGLKDQLGDMSEEECVELLASNGNLIKRPFLVAGDVVTVGFNEQSWAEIFASFEC